MVRARDGFLDKRGIEDAQLRSGGRCRLGMKCDAGEGADLSCGTCDARANGGEEGEHAETLADWWSKRAESFFWPCPLQLGEDGNY
jgi:hypothetical protein